MNLRWIVLKILDAIEFEGIFVHDALEQEMAGKDLTKQERGFIKKVVFGVLENRIYLDHVINQFSKVKVKKMKPAVRHTLRLSVYQLLFMPNLPQSAVCNEAVKLIKKRHMDKLSGFVNGVLRTIGRSGDQIKMPDRKKEPVRFLSVKYSFEESFVQMLLDKFSMETTEAFLSVSNEEAPLTLRVNGLKTDFDALQGILEGEKVTLTKGKWLPYAGYLEGIDRLELLESFKKGLFTVQDESSMLVTEVGWQEGVKKVVDVCAAPGGKSIHMAERLGEDGLVKAFDISRSKTALIEENLTRLGVKNVSVDIWDAAQFNPSLESWADLVIADVPCSGLGIIRKKPDIKWHTDSEKIDSLVSLQRDILSNVKAYVKSGGVLLYSTCTVLPQENEENVSWFLENNPDFCLDRVEGPYGDPETGMVRLMPMKAGHDGFFIARLKRL